MIFWMSSGFLLSFKMSGLLMDCSLNFWFYFYRSSISLADSITLFWRSLSSASTFKFVSFKALDLSFSCFNLFYNYFALRYSSALSITLLKLGSWVILIIFYSNDLFSLFKPSISWNLSSVVLSLASKFLIASSRNLDLSFSNSISRIFLFNF